MWWIGIDMSLYVDQLAVPLFRASSCVSAVHQSMDAVLVLGIHTISPLCTVESYIVNRAE